MYSDEGPIYIIVSPQTFGFSFLVSMEYSEEERKGNSE
jgi:hypothetical protein